MEGTVIKTLKIKGAEVVGGTFVGALVGAIQTPGDALWSTVLENCSVENCKVEGPTLANPETPADGFGTGGLVGLIDQRLTVTLRGCSSSGCDIYGSYGVGGLVGIYSIFSNLTLSDCQNNSGNVVSDFSGAGGLIGAADTLHVLSSTNKAEVEGASRFDPTNKEHALSIRISIDLRCRTQVRNGAAVRAADGLLSSCFFLFHGIASYLFWVSILLPPIRFRFFRGNPAQNGVFSVNFKKFTKSS